MTNDPRSQELRREDAKRADTYAQRGSLKHYLLSRGFFPDNEDVAREMLDGIIEENERLSEQVGRLKAEIDADADRERQIAYDEQRSREGKNAD